MTTEEKLEQLVDRLIVKTQDKQSEWKRINNQKFILKAYSGNIEISYNVVVGGKDYVELSIISHQDPNIVLAFLTTEKRKDPTTLFRLYGLVSKYHEEYVNSYIDKLMADVQKLGSF